MPCPSVIFAEGLRSNARAKVKTLPQTNSTPECPALQKCFNTTFCKVHTRRMGRDNVTFRWVHPFNYLVHFSTPGNRSCPAGGNEVLSEWEKKDWTNVGGGHSAINLTISLLRFAYSTTTWEL